MGEEVHGLFAKFCKSNLTLVQSEEFDLAGLDKISDSLHPFDWQNSKNILRVLNQIEGVSDFTTLEEVRTACKKLTFHGSAPTDGALLKAFRSYIEGTTYHQTILTQDSAHEVVNLQVCYGTLWTKSIQNVHVFIAT